MLDNLQDFKRTYYCGDITAAQLGEEVIIMGWVQNRRDHGGLVFIDLRDRTGQVQAVFNPIEDPNTHQKSHDVRSEFVLGMKGTVRKRPDDMLNPKLKTGQIEIFISELRIFNKAKTPPFTLDDHTDITEAVKLKYRYLDLRKESVQKNFILRHKVAQITRNFFDKNGFIEIETPILTKSTPEGARDYLVPSRVNPGDFFALPQSPQLFKQLLMVSGFDRYCQIVKCFRDEDLRADRQPEFTQIDLEMSFITQEDIMTILEDYMVNLFKEILNVEIAKPFLRLKYDEARARFGSDKPDLRYDLEIKEITEILANSEAKIFAATVKNGGVIRAICAPGAAVFSRKQLDDLVDLAISFGAKGLAWIRIIEGQWQGPLVKFLKDSEKESLTQALKIKEGDVIFFGADQAEIVANVLGQIRVVLAKELKIIPENEYKFCWVTHFPMFEFDLNHKRWVAMHHPFTSPMEDDLKLLATDPSKVRAQAYDLVINGSEIGGGSIRIHQPEIQKQVFQTLGISEEEAQDKFGFLLDALSFGAPPHGGCAFGLDRLVMILAGASSLREVIAFPKTQKAQCLMTNAPSSVDMKQLLELSLKIDKKA